MTDQVKNDVIIAEGLMSQEYDDYNKKGISSNQNIEELLSVLKDNF
jgi:hypothetical protein